MNQWISGPVTGDNIYRPGQGTNLIIVVDGDHVARREAGKVPQRVLKSDRERWQGQGSNGELEKYQLNRVKKIIDSMHSLVLT